MSKFFSYDQDCGFELHETAEEAQQTAQEYIDQYREDAGDGWDEAAGYVCWGEVKQISEEHTFNAGDEDDTDKEFADYTLEDVD